MNNKNRIIGFFVSSEFVISAAIVYELIIIILLVTELYASSLRATNQSIVLLALGFIPILIISSWNRISSGKFSRIKFGDVELYLNETLSEKTKAIKNEVTSELVEYITASTESTVYSLASFMMIKPREIPQYEEIVIQRLREDKTIFIGCQDYTEQRILCAIITHLLRQHWKNHGWTEDKIKPKYNFGSVGLNFTALSRGDIDIYPAYTWQGFEMVYSTSLSHKRESLITEEPSLQEANDRISNLNDLFQQLSIPLKWICYTGFYDDWKIVVRESYAKERDFLKISQLRHDKTLKFGCEYDFFARPNGYNLLTKPDCYGLKFKKSILMEHTKVYEALKNREVDVIDGFTTDPDINDTNLYRILKDDKCLFGRYYSSILVSNQLLNIFPDIESTLQSINGVFGQQEMSDMIKDIDNKYPTVDRNHIEEVEKVTKDFLRKKGKL